MGTKPQDVTERDVLCVDDVAEIMRCAKSTAYQIIRKINSELKAEGLIIMRGRVPRRAVYQRLGIKGV